MCITKFTHSKSIQITIVKLAYLIPVIFFGLSAIRVGSLFHSTLFVIGMILMTVLAFKADSSNPKVNLTEQFIIPPHSYASLYD